MHLHINKEFYRFTKDLIKILKMATDTESEVYMSFSAEEIEEFKTEALELLDTAEKSLLALDQGAEFQSAFDAVFRGFHNLKGGTGMMELHKLQAHTHELENILMGLKAGPIIPKEYISLFLRGIDAARTLLDGGKVNFDFSVAPPATQTVDSNAAVATVKIVDTPAPVEEKKSEDKKVAQEIPESTLNEFVSECEETLERVSNNLQLIEKGIHTKDTVDALYRDVHSMKGSSYLFSFNKLGDLTHAMESSLEKIRNGTHVPSSELLNTLFKCMEIIENLVEKIKTKSSDEDTAELIASIIHSLNSYAEQLQTAEAPVEAPPKVQEPTFIDPVESPVAQTSVPPPTPVDQPATQPAMQKEAEGASSIRVPVALLDNLMTLMGEMVLVRNQVLQFSNKSDDLEFVSMSKRLNVVTSEIQGEMMKTRMQPIGNVLSKFNRVIRDLSHELKKNINLNLHGSETELDKSLLEAIKDPLTHIVRNSCDHGIETPEARRKAGKPDVGTINIRAYHEGGQVVIEVSDDGKGLHKDVLIKKAIEKGLITETQALKLTEKEIFGLIFAPGFSTAQKITNVSGRGVGMDVVRTNIERIGGAVDLASVSGAGTTIKIKIPLTLAIVPALIVKCGNGIFAIPQVKLEELVRVDQSSTDNKIEVLHGAPVYRLRGNILPLVDLNKVLGIETNTKIDYENSIFNIAVLNAEDCSFGVIIDEVKDTADIVVKPLTRLLKSLQVYSGATILGDGSVALIFDVPGIAKVAQLGHEKNEETEEQKRKDERSRMNNEIQDFLLLKLNSPTKHALALAYVNRLEEFKIKDVEFSGNQRMIRYRDVILPLVSANEQLGYGSHSKENESVPVIVIQRAGMLFGLEVDGIIDTLSTAAETDTNLVKHPGIYGNLNTEDELIVVVDPFELISKAYPDLAGHEAGGKLAAAREEILTELSKQVQSTPAHSRQKRVLLVEDTVFFRKAIKSVLEKDGFEVISATNGEEAIEVLNQQNGAFDIIVSDIEMPKLNGFQLAQAIRKNPSFCHLPMLAISSRADKQYVADGTKAGFDVYLEKLKPEILLSAVADLLKTKGAA